MTESEAFAKWCPFSRQVAVTAQETGAAATANRDAGNHYGVTNVMCLGSACMAWRWKRVPVRSDDPTADDTKLSTTQGYCGLAGAES